MDQGTSLSVLDLETGLEVASLEYPSRDEMAWRERVVRGEAASGFRPAEEARSFAFDASGERLAIGLDAGARVFGWEEVLAAGGTMPKCELFIQAPLVDVAKYMRMQAVNGVTFDRDGRLVFGGLDGALHVASFRGEHRARTLELPGRPPLFRFVAARDRRTFAVVARPRFFDRRSDPAELQIWGLEVLSAELDS